MSDLVRYRDSAGQSDQIPLQTVVERKLVLKIKHNLHFNLTANLQTRM